MTSDESPKPPRGWLRAAGLFVLAATLSVAPPGALVAVPLLMLLGLGGIRSLSAFAVTVAAMVVVLMGPRDGLWFAERGWAVMAGGVFVGLSFGLPAWRVTSRTLMAVLSTMALCGVFLALRADAWMSIDGSMGNRLRAGFANWLDAMSVMRGGDPVPAATVTAVLSTADALVTVFPAVIALESMAALAVAWWLYVRVVHGRADGVGSLGMFRFNDHLVWVMILGLVLVGVGSGDDLTRVGANLAVFMGALYALRGLGVVSFVSDGISFFRASLMALVFLFAAPVVIGFTMLLGIADTWIDVRERVGSMPA